MFTDEEVKAFKEKGNSLIDELDRIDEILVKLKDTGPTSDAIEQALELNIQRIEILLKLIRIPQACGHTSCKLDADGRILSRIDGTVSRMINVCAAALAKEVLGDVIEQIAKDETEGCTKH